MTPRYPHETLRRVAERWNHLEAEWENEERRDLGFLARNCLALLDEIATAEARSVELIEALQEIAKPDEAKNSPYAPAILMRQAAEALARYEARP